MDKSLMRLLGQAKLRLENAQQAESSLRKKQTEALLPLELERVRAQQELLAVVGEVLIRGVLV